MKSAADMIVHSAGGHFAQREQIHFERVLTVLALRISSVKACDKIQRNRPRKFRGDAKAAFARIKAAIKLLVSVLENFDVHEIAIHDCRGRLVFERFVRHYMTPVTS